jgi:hypothetical protein
VAIQLQATDYSTYLTIPPERLAAWDAANAGLGEVMMRRGMRVVRVGNGLLPSEWRARMLGVEAADLEGIFRAGLLADPAELAAAGGRLREILSGSTRPGSPAVKSRWAWIRCARTGAWWWSASSSMGRRSVRLR